MIPVFRKILSPVAFDDNSLAALDYAAVFARQPGVTLYLLHVVQTDAGHIQEELQRATKNEWLAESIAKNRLKLIALDKFGESLSYDVLVRTGEPAQTILDTAMDVGAHLIVMATHGRLGLSHFFLGSVAERVIREATCPVLTLRGHLGGIATGTQTTPPRTDA